MYESGETAPHATTVVTTIFLISQAEMTRAFDFSKTLAVFFIAAQLAHAQTEENGVEVFMSKEEARALGERASQLKSQAEQQSLLDKTECYKKILVSSCLETANKQKREKIANANSLAKQGREAERELSKREKERKAREQAADLPRISAEEQERAEHSRQGQTMRDAGREEKLKQEELDAKIRHEKIQEEEIARQKRHMEQARKDAEHEKQKPAMLKAWQDRQNGIAEHAAQIDDRLKRKDEDKKRREAEQAAIHLAEERAKNNAAKRSLLCQLMPSQFCKED